jgi:hypothetical protein
MPDGALPLQIVDGLELPASVRAVLRPGEVLTDPDGRGRTLPRFFYQIDSWQTALDLSVTPHFKLWEFIGVDVREAPLQRQFPRYVPCAVTLLAAHLEMIRDVYDTYIHIAANGAYRSPSHALSRAASTHCWATAANIYRIGDDWFSSREAIERCATAIRRITPAFWVRPYGHGPGEADDHVHVDIGYALLEPRDATGLDPEEVARIENAAAEA